MPGGAARLAELSVRMLAELRRRCAPAITGLAMNGGGGGGGAPLCFFAIENSKGYRGDATIRELVAAIERAAHTLPSMKLKVPLEWLLVLDELRRLAAQRRCVLYDEVKAIAQVRHAALRFESFESYVHGHTSS